MGTKRPYDSGERGSKGQRIMVSGKRFAGKANIGSKAAMLELQAGKVSPPREDDYYPQVTEEAKELFEDMQKSGIEFMDENGDAMSPHLAAWTVASPNGESTAYGVMNLGDSKEIREANLAWMTDQGDKWPTGWNVTEYGNLRFPAADLYDAQDPDSGIDLGGYANVADWSENITKDGLIDGAETYASQQQTAADEEFFSDLRDDTFDPDDMDDYMDDVMDGLDMNTNRSDHKDTLVGPVEAAKTELEATFRKELEEGRYDLDEVTGQRIPDSYLHNNLSGMMESTKAMRDYRLDHDLRFREQHKDEAQARDVVRKREHDREMNRLWKEQRKREKEARKK